jgi:hypothetical protein
MCPFPFPFNGLFPLPHIHSLVARRSLFPAITQTCEEKASFFVVAESATKKNGRKMGKRKNVSKMDKTMRKKGKGLDEPIGGEEYLDFVGNKKGKESE